MISTADIDTIYLVNLETRLDQNIPQKMCWIQLTRLAIYKILNRAKRNGKCPIWSAIVARNISKCKMFCVAVSCMLETFCETTTSYSNQTKHFRMCKLSLR